MCGASVSLCTFCWWARHHLKATPSMSCLRKSKSVITSEWSMNIILIFQWAFNACEFLEFQLVCPVKRTTWFVKFYKRTDTDDRRPSNAFKSILFIVSSYRNRCRFTVYWKNHGQKTFHWTKVCVCIRLNASLKILTPNLIKWMIFCRWIFR